MHFTLTFNVVSSMYVVRRTKGGGYLKLKSDLTKKGLPIIAMLVIALVSAVAVGVSGLASNKAVVTFKLVEAGPNRPSGWPNHTWGGNFTGNFPRRIYIRTLDGKPYNFTPIQPGFDVWDLIPSPKERNESWRKSYSSLPGGPIRMIIKSINGTILKVCNSSDPLDPPLPPGEYMVNINFTLPRDGKDHHLLYFNLTATGTGQYILHFQMGFINPYNKWNHLVGWLHRMGTDSTAKLKTGDIPTEHRIWSPAFVVVPRETFVYYQYVDYNFTVTETGSVTFYFESHCIITDINGDGKVDLKDVSPVAKMYGTHLDYGIKDANYPYDMNCDFWIDFEDLHLVMLDYGKTIPP
jgi:hypothetical protein